MASVHEDILDAVTTVIQGLGLDGVDADSITTCMIPPTPPSVANPAIFVTPNGMKQTIGGTNARKDISYPVAVFIKDNTLQPHEIGNSLNYRESIQNAFEHKRLAGISTCKDVVIDGQPILNPQLMQLHWPGQVISLKVITREPR